MVALAAISCVPDGGGGTTTTTTTATSTTPSTTTTTSTTSTTLPDTVNDPVDVAVGGQFACARLDGGGVKCFGTNGYGQLGDGTTDASVPAVSVAGIDDAVALAVGQLHACVIRSDTTVWCWGRNAKGQLGDGTNVDRSIAAPVAGLTGATDLASYGEATCAVTPGAVRCWGDNSRGQLGINSTVNSTVPVVAVGLTDATEVSTGGEHACAVTSSGGVSCWGANNHRQSGPTASSDLRVPTAVAGLTGVADVALGNRTSCAILVDGTAKCWGYNWDGQVGDGFSRTDASTPKVVQGVADLASMALASESTCGLGTDGSVRCWGGNRFAVLGHRDLPKSPTAAVVSDLSGITALSGNAQSFCYVRSDAEVLCRGVLSSAPGLLEPLPIHGFGDEIDHSPQLILPAPIARAATAGAAVDFTVSALDDIDGAIAATCDAASGSTFDPGTTLVTCEATDSGGNTTEGSFDVVVVDPAIETFDGGGAHSCAVTPAAGVRCWGLGTSGQLGNGSSSSPSPVDVSGLTDVVSVSAGVVHTCALRADGSVWCWGSNADGRLGRGTVGSTFSTAAPAVGIADAVSVSAGNTRTCAVLGTGAVSCWGSGSGTPAPIAAITDATQVSVGAVETCAVRLGGQVVCFANTTAATVTTTADVSALTDIVEVTVSEGSGTMGHACALHETGRVLCWGSIAVGQTGSGVQTLPSFGNQPVPAFVVGLHDVVSLDAGSGHSCAVTRNSMTKCWGDSAVGQVGDLSSTVGVGLYVQIPGALGATALATGNSHTCVSVGSGLKCWGLGTSGQLGNGGTSTSKVPVDVVGAP